MRSGTFTKGFDADAYIKKAEGSLKRFGLDYVDTFLFPFAGKKETVINEGALKAMLQLKKRGKPVFWELLHTAILKKL
jgi:diketogulonate reductase-like aldo/keto reductase